MMDSSRPSTNNDAFDFNMKIAKKSMLRLPKEQDQIICSKWLWRLEKLKRSGDNAERAVAEHYLILLLLCIQHERLVGPFKVIPSDDALSTTDDPRQHIQPADISEMVREEEYREFGKPAYDVEVSGNLHDYVAYQEIPQFGAHFYYAHSKTEGVYKWNGAENAILPIGYQYPAVDSSFTAEQEGVAESVEMDNSKNEIAIEQTSSQQTISSNSSSDVQSLGTPVRTQRVIPSSSSENLTDSGYNHEGEPLRLSLHDGDYLNQEFYEPIPELNELESVRGSPQYQRRVRSDDDFDDADYENFVIDSEKPRIHQASKQDDVNYEHRRYTDEHFNSSLPSGHEALHDYERLNRAFYEPNLEPTEPLTNWTPEGKRKIRSKATVHASDREYENFAADYQGPIEPISSTSKADLNYEQGLYTEENFNSSYPIDYEALYDYEHLNRPFYVHNSVIFESDESPSETNTINFAPDTPENSQREAYQFSPEWNFTYDRDQPESEESEYDSAEAVHAKNWETPETSPQKEQVTANLLDEMLGSDEVENENIIRMVNEMKRDMEQNQYTPEKRVQPKLMEFDRIQDESVSEATITNFTPGIPRTPVQLQSPRRADSPGRVVTLRTPQNRRSLQAPATPDSPIIFKYGAKRPFDYVSYRPDEFGLDDNEEFRDAEEALKGLDWVEEYSDLDEEYHQELSEGLTEFRRRQDEYASETTITNLSPAIPRTPVKMQTPRKADSPGRTVTPRTPQNQRSLQPTALPDTPIIFKSGAKRPFDYVSYRPDEFGLDDNEEFGDPNEIFMGLQWTPSGREGRIQALDRIENQKNLSPETRRIKLQFQQSVDRRNQKIANQQETTQHPMREKVKEIRKTYQPRIIDMDQSESLDEDEIAAEIAKYEDERVNFGSLPSSEESNEFLSDQAMVVDDFFGDVKTAEPPHILETIDLMDLDNNGFIQRENQDQHNRYDPFSPLKVIPNNIAPHLLEKIDLIDFNNNAFIKRQNQAQDYRVDPFSPLKVFPINDELIDDVDEPEDLFGDDVETNLTDELIGSDEMENDIMAHIVNDIKRDVPDYSRIKPLKWVVDMEEMVDTVPQPSAFPQSEALLDSPNTQLQKHLDEFYIRLAAIPKPPDSPNTIERKNKEQRYWEETEEGPRIRISPRSKTLRAIQIAENNLFDPDYDIFKENQQKPREPIESTLRDDLNYERGLYTEENFNSSYPIDYEALYDYEHLNRPFYVPNSVIFESDESASTGNIVKFAPDTPAKRQRPAYQFSPDWNYTNDRDQPESDDSEYDSASEVQATNWETPETSQMELDGEHTQAPGYRVSPDNADAINEEIGELVDDSLDMSASSSDNSVTYIQIPIPDTDGLFAYATPSKVDHMVRFLQTADNTQKLMVASVSQTLAHQYLRDQMRMTKGEKPTATYEDLPIFPKLAMQPDFLTDADALYPQTDGDLPSPMFTSHKPQMDDDITAYHHYLQEMLPYGLEANDSDEDYQDAISNEDEESISENENVDLNFEVPNVPDREQSLNRRITEYVSESSSSTTPEPYAPDMLLDKLATPVPVKFRPNRGLLDLSFEKGHQQVKPLISAEGIPERDDLHLLDSDELDFDDMFGEDHVIGTPKRAENAQRTPPQQRYLSPPKPVGVNRHDYYQDLAAGNYRKELWEDNINDEIQISLAGSSEGDEYKALVQIDGINVDGASVVNEVDENVAAITDSFKIDFATFGEFGDDETNPASLIDFDSSTTENEEVIIARAVRQTGKVGRIVNAAKKAIKNYQPQLDTPSRLMTENIESMTHVPTEYDKFIADYQKPREPTAGSSKPHPDDLNYEQGQYTEDNFNSSYQIDYEKLYDYEHLNRPFYVPNSIILESDDSASAGNIITFAPDTPARSRRPAYQFSPDWNYTYDRDQPETGESDNEVYIIPNEDDVRVSDSDQKEFGLDDLDIIDDRILQQREMKDDFDAFIGDKTAKPHFLTTKPVAVIQEEIQPDDNVVIVVPDLRIKPLKWVVESDVNVEPEPVPVDANPQPVNESLNSTDMQIECDQMFYELYNEVEAVDKPEDSPNTIERKNKERTYWEETEDGPRIRISPRSKTLRAIQIAENNLFDPDYDIFKENQQSEPFPGSSHFDLNYEQGLYTEDNFNSSYPIDYEALYDYGHLNRSFYVPNSVIFESDGSASEANIINFAPDTPATSQRSAYQFSPDWNYGYDRDQPESEDSEYDSAAEVHATNWETPKSSPNKVQVSTNLSDEILGSDEMQDDIMHHMRRDGMEKTRRTPPRRFEPRTAEQDAIMEEKYFQEGIAELAEFDRLLDVHNLNEEIKSQQKDIDLFADSLRATEKFKETRRTAHQQQGITDEDNESGTDLQSIAFLDQCLQPDLINPPEYRDFDEGLTSNMLNSSIDMPASALDRPLIGAPEPRDAVKELDESLERRVQYEMEAEQRPLQDNRQQREQQSKFGRNVLDQTAEDIEEYLSDSLQEEPFTGYLIHNPSNPPPALNIPFVSADKNLLDNSFDSDELQDALIRTPKKKFVGQMPEIRIQLATPKFKVPKLQVEPPSPIIEIAPDIPNAVDTEKYLNDSQRQEPFTGYLIHSPMRTPPALNIPFNLAGRNLLDNSFDNEQLQGALIRTPKRIPEIRIHPPSPIFKIIPDIRVQPPTPRIIVPKIRVQPPTPNRPYSGRIPDIHVQPPTPDRKYSGRIPDIHVQPPSTDSESLDSIQPATPDKILSQSAQKESPNIEERYFDDPDRIEMAQIEQTMLDVEASYSGDLDRFEMIQHEPRMMDASVEERYPIESASAQLLRAKIKSKQMQRQNQLHGIAEDDLLNVSYIEPLERYIPRFAEDGRQLLDRSLNQFEMEYATSPLIRSPLGYISDHDLSNYSLNQPAPLYQMSPRQLDFIEFLDSDENEPDTVSAVPSDFDKFSADYRPSGPFPGSSHFDLNYEQGLYTEDNFNSSYPIDYEALYDYGHLNRSFYVPNLVIFESDDSASTGNIIKFVPDTPARSLRPTYQFSPDWNYTYDRDRPDTGESDNDVREAAEPIDFQTNEQNLARGVPDYSRIKPLNWVDEPNEIVESKPVDAIPQPDNESLNSTEFQIELDQMFYEVYNAAEAVDKPEDSPNTMERKNKERTYWEETEDGPRIRISPRSKTLRAIQIAENNLFDPDYDIFKENQQKPREPVHSTSKDFGDDLNYELGQYTEDNFNSAYPIDYEAFNDYEHLNRPIYVSNSVIFDSDESDIITHDIVQTQIDSNDIIEILKKHEAERQFPLLFSQLDNVDVINDTDLISEPFESFEPPLPVRPMTDKEFYENVRFKMPIEVPEQHRKFVDNIFDEIGQEQHMERFRAARSPQTAIHGRSVLLSKNVDEIKNRYRRMKGLPPIDYPEPASTYDEPNLMYPPIVAPFQDVGRGILDESLNDTEKPSVSPLVNAPASVLDQLNAIEEFETSLDRIMEHVKEAEALESNSDAHSDETYKHSDFFNTNIVASISTTSEEASVELVDFRPLLDYSNGDDGLINSSEMEADILHEFGEVSTPIKYKTSSPTYPHQPTMESDFLDHEEGIQYESVESISNEESNEKTRRQMLINEIIERNILQEEEDSNLSSVSSGTIISDHSTGENSQREDRNESNLSIYEELADHERGFAWLEQMVPMTKGPRIPQTLSTDQKTITIKTPPPSKPMGPSRPPHIQRAIDLNKKYREEKKLQRQKALAAKSGKWNEPPKQDVAKVAPPPATPAPQLTETEQIILKLKQRILLANGVTATESEALVESVPEPESEPHQTLSTKSAVKPKLGVRRSKLNANALGRKKVFEFHVSEDQRERAEAIAKLYLDKHKIANAHNTKLSAKTPKKPEKIKHDKNVLAAYAMKKGKFELPAEDLDKAREINRLYREEKIKKKQLLEERRTKKTAPSLVQKTEEKVVVVEVQQTMSERSPERSTERSPERPKTPLSVLDTLNRMLGLEPEPKTEESDNAEEETEQEGTQQEQRVLTAEEREKLRRSRAEQINKKFADEQQKKLARQNQRRQRSKSVGRAVQVGSRAAPQFEKNLQVTSEQQQRADQINKKYTEEVERRRQKKAVKKTSSLDSKRDNARKGPERKALDPKAKLASVIDFMESKRQRALEIDGLNREVQRLVLEKKEAKRAKTKENEKIKRAKAAEAKAKAAAEAAAVAEAAKAKSVGAPRAQRKKDTARLRSKSVPRPRRFTENITDEMRLRAQRLNQMTRKEREALRLGLPPPNQPKSIEVEAPEIPDPTDLSVEGLWRQLKYRRQLLEEREQLEVHLRPEQMGTNPFGVIGAFPITPPRPVTPPIIEPIVETEVEPEPEVVVEEPPKTIKKKRVPSKRSLIGATRKKPDLVINTEQLERAQAINEKIAVEQRKRQAEQDENQRKRKEARATKALQEKQAAIAKRNGRFKLDHTKEQADRMVEVNQAYITAQAEKQKRKADMRANKSAYDGAKANAPKTPAGQRIKPKPSFTSVRKVKNLAIAEIPSAKLARAQEINEVYQAKQDVIQVELEKKKQEKRNKIAAVAKAAKVADEKTRQIFQFKQTSEMLERALKVNAQFKKVKEMRGKKGKIVKTVIVEDVREVTPLQHGPYNQYGPQIDALRVLMDDQQFLIRRNLEIIGPLMEGLRPRRIEFDQPAIEAAAEDILATESEVSVAIVEPTVPRRDPKLQAIELNKQFIEADRLNKIKQKELRDRRLEKERSLYMNKNPSATNVSRSTAVQPTKSSSSRLNVTGGYQRVTQQQHQQRTAQQSRTQPRVASSASGRHLSQRR